VATISDVARHAGVATSTVSHVLNGTRYVSPETTAAVERAVKAVGYTPNVLARALARSSTNMVGIAMSTTTNRYFGDIVNAIEEQCSNLGMMVLLANTRDDPTQELKVVQALHQRRVDGIILAPCHDADRRSLAYLEENAIPSVLVDRLVAPHFDQVGVENRNAMADLVSHLIEHGHRRIGFLAGPASFTTANERIEGYRTALANHGLSFDPKLLLTDNTDVNRARAAAEQMLAGPTKPTAMVGGNNLTTIGIMHAVHDAALRVPDDIAVAGFDDFDWADCFTPRLTVMAQDCDEIGKKAALMLKKRLQSPDCKPRTLRVAPTLIVRNSCGCNGRVGPAE
jgi:LacI family transcriptional regulator